MTPETMAELHTKAFAPERGWTAQEFSALVNSQYTRLFTRPNGFALLRIISGEAELLTLAVDPDHQRQGIADRLMRDWMHTLRAHTVFLEVAADNAGAQALYSKHGFAKIGLRKEYYVRPNAPPVDAVLMQAALTHRQTDESKPSDPKTG